MVKSKEPNPKIIYKDIIDHPHWQSPSRPKMSPESRASQFSAFSALAGYEDMIIEETKSFEK